MIGRLKHIRQLRELELPSGIPVVPPVHVTWVTDEVVSLTCQVTVGKPSPFLNNTNIFYIPVSEHIAKQIGLALILVFFQHTSEHHFSRAIFWPFQGNKQGIAQAMDTKSLPEQYKYPLYVVGDVSEHIVVQIEMTLILVFFPMHLKLLSLEQKFGPSRVVVNGCVCVCVQSMEAKSLPKHHTYLLHIPGDMSEHMGANIKLALILVFYPINIRHPFLEPDFLSCQSGKQGSAQSMAAKSHCEQWKYLSYVPGDVSEQTPDQLKWRSTIFPFTLPTDTVFRELDFGPSWVVNRIVHTV